MLKHKILPIFMVIILWLVIQNETVDDNFWNWYHVFKYIQKKKNDNNVYCNNVLQ